MKKKIGFIGTGKMAEALITSMLKTELVERIIGSDKSPDRLKEIEKKTGIDVTADNKEAANRSDILFLSVKPQDMKAVLEEIKDSIKEQIVVSIAAGIKISFIESLIGDRKIIRVMPNTPCIVGEMAAGFSANNKVSGDDKKYISKLLNSAGTALLLEEKDLDAVTGLSGSGPAFVAYIIKAMADAGEDLGLSKEIALELAIQTCIGTGKLLKDGEISPSELIKMVSSHGGTTIAGREVLEKSDVRAVINRTITAAAQRSREIGR